MGGVGLLPFLDLARYGDAPALFDDTGEGWMSYQDLDRSAQDVCAVLETRGALAHQQKELLLLCIPRTRDGVAAYLGAAKAGVSIAMTEPAAANLAQTIMSYAPDWIAAPAGETFDQYDEMEWPLTSLRLWRTQRPRRDDLLHPDFFLMLMTSGSTGSSKGVRLSYNNIAANTRSIIKSLGLTSADHALGHLPLSYSFGLSVLHTQLSVGAPVILTEESMMGSRFWKIAREQKASFFPGVPYHFEMMARLGLDRLNVPHLTKFAQAGGKMHLPLTMSWLDQIRKRSNGALFIMYGQTEASPRMSCFPLHLFPHKAGTSGQALEGGRFEIVDNEIIYHGPNVMMGHATCRADLALGDLLCGRLETGDLGSVDKDGYVTITGRKQRFAKLYGQRIALDDLEKIVVASAPCIALERPEKIIIATTNGDKATHQEILSLLESQTNLPQTWFHVQHLASFPHKENGKIDYQSLEQIIGDSP